MTERKIIIDAMREGYGTDQIRETMTVGELIEFLQDYDEDLPVYLGHDRQGYGFYTYGGITPRRIEEIEGDDEEDEDE